jgi:hypothetical protein
MGQPISFPSKIKLRPGHPDFLDLPWNLPISEWQGVCSRLEELPQGISRHPVIFVNYSGILYAIKEMPEGVAQAEYEALGKLEELRIPAVIPIGHAKTETDAGPRSVLITRYLDHSVPYRTLFQSSNLMRYRDHILDAISGMLVQLHLSGIFWGDCSLSNTLFRRDAGALQAYLVDAETAEHHPDGLPPTLRHHDLEIMEENINGDLADLQAEDTLAEGVPISETGAYIRVQYQRLWEEITREDVIYPEEHYRIQERIRALNALGFSVSDVELRALENGNQLRLRVLVSDRNFHRDKLLSLTGLETEEMQARTMMNEIYELKASLSRRNNRSTPLSVAAYYWLENLYKPTIHCLEPIMDPDKDAGELYCQVLEHKWYLSEERRIDVGHEAAVEDFLQRFA